MGKEYISGKKELKKWRTCCKSEIAGEDTIVKGVEKALRCFLRLFQSESLPGNSGSKRRFFIRRVCFLKADYLFTFEI